MNTFNSIITPFEVHYVLHLVDIPIIQTSTNHFWNTMI